MDFDPSIDPLEVVEEAYFGVARRSSFRKQYRNSIGTFTAPLTHFQRPTARFDEPALFAAAEKQLLRAAIMHRVVMATLQRTSTFMNASASASASSSGGRSARQGPSYINGGAGSPRVLIALMNIWRVHYNFFGWRPYAASLDTEAEIEEVSAANEALNRLLKNDFEQPFSST